MLSDNSSIAIFTHTQYRDNNPVYGPPDNIKDYLKMSFGGNIYYLQHSLYRANGSVLTMYKNGGGKVLHQYNFHKNWINILRYFADLCLTVKLFLWREKIHTVIAVDPLNFLYAFILKKIRKVDSIIFYTMDYAYKRFDNPILDWSYHVLDRFAVRNCDQSWSACKKIADVRRDQGIEKKRNVYIPNSPIFHGVKIKNADEIDRFSLILVFSNYLQVDFKIIFDSMELLFHKFPQIKLKLIGRGNFKNNVEAMIKDKDFFNRVDFLDIPSHSVTLTEISKSAIGLECNTQSLYWNEFREPIKIREYIAFGLPIISKPGHALVEEIREEGIGFIVTNADEFVKAVETFFNDFDYYIQTRKKVLALSKRYDKKRILDNVFLGNLEGQFQS